jgi:VanZ family protein
MKLYAPALAWGIFIFILSTIPGKDLPKIPNISDLITIDKIVHMLFYGLLTALILRFAALGREPLKVLGIALLSTGYGWFIEWFQGAYCTDRLFEVMDGVANTIGALAVALYFIFKKKKN